MDGNREFNYLNIMNWINVVNVMKFNNKHSTVFKVVLMLSYYGNNAKGVFIAFLLIYRYRHSQNNCDELSIPVIFNSCSITISYIDSITASEYEFAFKLRFSNLELLISLKFDEIH